MKQLLMTMVGMLCLLVSIGGSSGPAALHPNLLDLILGSLGFILVATAAMRRIRPMQLATHAIVRTRLRNAKRVPTHRR